MPFVRPVKAYWAVLPGTVTAEPPDQVMRYESIGSPLVAGADQLTVTCWSPSSTAGASGLPGTSRTT